MELVTGSDMPVVKWWRLLWLGQTWLVCFFLKGTQVGGDKYHILEWEHCLSIFAYKLLTGIIQATDLLSPQRHMNMFMGVWRILKWQNMWVFHPFNKKMHFWEVVRWLWLLLSPSLFSGPEFASSNFDYYWNMFLNI